MEHSEEVVKYFVYPSTPMPFSVLHKWGNDVLQGVWPHVEDYLWHKDPFQLVADESLGCLHGQTQFGDNIEDEWFIISLLLDISKRFDAMCTVTDNDGQCLLIEASDVLEEWLQPDTADNRVFLMNGQVAIIPLLPQNPSQLAVMAQLPSIGSITLSLEDALQVLRSSNGSTFQVQAVTAAVHQRCNGYPKKALSHDFAKHTVECILPVPVAYCLQQCKHLIGPAVAAFYERDPAGLQLCQQMAHFHPNQGLVHCSVEFSRCMYAMLSQQRCATVPCFAPHLHADDPRLFRMETLGMKVAVGFEIAYHLHRPVPGGQTPRQADPTPILQELGWRHGDFQGTVDALLSRMPTDLGQKNFSLIPEDSEAWLYLSPSDLDARMQDLAPTSGHESSAKSEAVAQEQAQAEVGRLVDAVQQLLGRSSDFEGVELPPGGGSMELPPNPPTSAPRVTAIASPATTFQSQPQGEPSSSAQTVDIGPVTHANPSSRSLSRTELLQARRRIFGGGSAAEESEGSDAESDASVSGEEDESTRAPAPWFMEAMDREVHEGLGAEGKEGVEAADSAAVHTLAENWLRSLEAEAGQPGPVGALAAMLGVRIPPSCDPPGWGP
eukprot:GGOE01001175.1.p1 GENE.GGOE01001175.1~~GGOE01001175.1.p1  ORF type:complete len:608 (+),score=117.60 GGOE01001175.1:100-1923(+)